MAKKNEVEEIKQPEIKRIYNDGMHFDSDLFKLEVANMLKNIGYDDKDPVLKNVEHCHFYRTIDSNGRKQNRSSFVGGHTHDVIVKVNENNELVAECAPATGTKFNDRHTHETTYLKSDAIEKRRMNKDASEFIAKISAPYQG